MVVEGGAGSEAGEGERGSRVPVKIKDPKLPPFEKEKERMLALCARRGSVHGPPTERRRTRSPISASGLLFLRRRGRRADQDGDCGEDRDSKMAAASVFPVKGSSHQLAARRVRAFVSELGYEDLDVTLTSDHEPAIKDLVSEVSKLGTTASTMKEESPVGSSASNGVVDMGNQAIDGYVRVIKIVLEARLNMKVPGARPAVARMVEFARLFVKRYEVGNDGRTPCERARGKTSKLLCLKFGEMLNFRRNRAPGRLAKLESSWEDGVFLGYRAASGEVVVGTKIGVFRAMTVHGKPEKQRWGLENMDMVGGTPWRTTPEQDTQDDEGFMPDNVINMEVPEAEKIERPEARDADVVSTRVYVRRKDFEFTGTPLGAR